MAGTDRTMHRFGKHPPTLDDKEAKCAGSQSSTR